MRSFNLPLTRLFLGFVNMANTNRNMEFSPNGGLNTKQWVEHRKTVNPMVNWTSIKLMWQIQQWTIPNRGLLVGMPIFVIFCDTTKLLPHGWYWGFFFGNRPTTSMEWKLIIDMEGYEEHKWDHHPTWPSSTQKIHRFPPLKNLPWPRCCSIFFRKEVVPQPPVPTMANCTSDAV